MAYMESIIEKAALLHDIGKVCLRAEPRRMPHSEAGKLFLKKLGAEERILRAVAYHHADALTDALKSSEMAENDIAYIIYEADNLAASTDRRNNENGEFGFDSKLSLENVFNVFRNSGETKTSYYLRSLTKEKRMSYPQINEIRATSSEYKPILQSLEQAFSHKSPDEMEVNELLQILEDSMSYIPSSTAKGEVADISLYDHQKLTAAFAVCMYQYFKQHEITDYKKYCYGSKQKSMRKEEMYLLVSGDISGIQNFIYTIPSKGALKSLRGRSFYLELLLENVVDEILSALHISRSCLLYTGGGHFYMLLPNTTEVIQVLESYAELVNSWFIEQFNCRLYLALGWTACSASEFIETDGRAGTGDVYRRVGRILAGKKLNRYTVRQLEQLFSLESADGNRECTVCHTSSSAVDLKPYMENEDSVLACQHCRNLLRLGKQVLDGDIFVVCSEPASNAVMLPGWKRDLYLTACTTEPDANDKSIVRMYVKNEVIPDKNTATRLWIGDYSIRTREGTAVEFQDLAECSNSMNKNTGINRLAVMRADVDNLGAAFMAGFPKAYATLTRTAVLSRQLSLFFKRYINSLCAGEVNGVNETTKTVFHLFPQKKTKPRNVHIVYSGGDDMFIVGTWDDVIELAVDIYQAFQQFTNGKLTFSAGIGFFKSGAPISQMARVAGMLEDKAKENDGKNSIVLFGRSTEYHSPEEELEVIPYHWDEFICSVCGEKLAFLQSHFAFGEQTGSGKVRIGKSSLYRLMSLLSAEKNEQSINLARFAYVLARLKPDEDKALTCYEEIRTQFYAWYKSKTDRQELLTAIQLIIYSLREKKERDDE